MDIVHKSQVSHMFTNRKSHMFHMAVCLVAAVAGFAVLAAKPAVAVTASLRDGSTVRGEFLTEKIAGATLFEKNLALAPSLVRAINFTGTNGESKVELSNGDRFAMTVSNNAFAVRSLLGDLKIPRASMNSLSFSSRSPAAKGASAGGLVYHCTFNSREEVSRPKVGPRGFFMAGEFTKGVDGLALHVPPYTSAARFELPPGTIGRKGTIEFWGKIDEGMARLTTGGCPRFFEIICYEPRDEISQDWNSNNGSGGAGLTFRIGGLPVMASSSCGRFTGYDFIKNNLYGWHHYALVWNADGVVLSNGTTAAAAVFMDGKPVLTTSAANWDGPPLANHRSFLVFPSREDEMPSYARVGYAVDEFKIWNFAKTDFPSSADMH